MRLEQNRICAPGKSQLAKPLLLPSQVVPVAEAKEHSGPQPLISALIALPKTYFTLHWGSLVSSLSQNFLGLPREKQAASSLPFIVSRLVPSGPACLMEHELYFSSRFTKGKEKSILYKPPGLICFFAATLLLLPWFQQLPFFPVRFS